MAAEKLYWGRDLGPFIEQYPDGFDILIAADVIYEEEQVLPLIQTVVAILKGDTFCCSLSTIDSISIFFIVLNTILLHSTLLYSTLLQYRNLYRVNAPLLLKTLMHTLRQCRQCICVL